MANTFKDYLIGKDLSSTTVTCYHRHILDFIAWLDSQQIEAEEAETGDLTAYMQHLQNKGQMNVTRNLQLVVIKHFFNYQIQNGQRENNPAQYMRIRGAKQTTLYPTLTKQELESIYQHYKVPKDDDPRSNRNWFKTYRQSKQRNKTMLGLMIWQGLTTAEVNKLSIKDMKLKEGKIYIAGTRKSAERTLDLKPQQIIELMEYQLDTRKEMLKYYQTEPESFYLNVPASGQKKSSINTTANIWKRLSQEVRTWQPRFVNFQQVRASVITAWLSEYNLRQVQYMAGHKYVVTTEGYRANQTDDLLKDIEMYHPIG